MALGKELSMDLIDGVIQQNAKRYETPQPYNHPQGAVILVNLANVHDKQ